MPDPVSAIRKVAEAAMAAIHQVRQDLQGFVDRTAAEPLGNAELPGYLLRYEVKFSLSAEMSQYFNDALLTFEVVSEDTDTITMDQFNQLAIAQINDALQADPTLGGMVEDILPIGSDNSQADTADVGSAVLQVRVTFYTLIRNHSTIVGHGGVLFP